MTDPNPYNIIYHCGGVSKCETKAPVTQADIAENVIRFKAFYEVAGHLPSKVAKRQ